MTNVVSQQSDVVPFYFQQTECRHCGKKVVMLWHDFCTACGKQINQCGPVFTELELPKEHRSMAMDHAIGNIHVGSPFCCFCGTQTAVVRSR